MARSRRDSETTISLFPFLSVLCCAIGALIVIISAQNLLAVGAADQTIEIAGTQQGRDPVYVECAKTSVVIYPQGLRIELPDANDDIRARLDNAPAALSQFLDELYADRTNRYLVLLIRPSGIETFRLCQILAERRGRSQRESVDSPSGASDYRRYENEMNRYRIRIGWDALLGEGRLIFTRDGKAVMTAAESTP